MDDRERLRVAAGTVQHAGGMGSMCGWAGSNDLPSAIVLLTFILALECVCTGCTFTRGWACAHACMP
jgi:hypothetical protein